MRVENFGIEESPTPDHSPAQKQPSWWGVWRIAAAVGLIIFLLMLATTLVLDQYH